MLLLVLLSTLAMGDCPVAASAETGAAWLVHTEASMELVGTGREQLLSFQIRDARRTLQALAQRPDGKAAAYYHLSVAALLDVFVQDDAAALEAFEAYSDSLAAELDRQPEVLWRDYLAAEHRLYRALAAAKRERYLKSAWLGRRAYKAFEELREEAPGFSEALKGWGLLHLAIGSLPKTYRWTLRVLGVGGSVEQGLAELDVAARCSRYNREEAATYLALTDVLMNLEPQRGLQRLAGLQAAYPESVLFGYLYGYALVLDRRAAEAEQVLRAVAAKADDSAYLYVDYTDYYLADALFRQERFAEAERYFRRYIERHPGPALKALAHYNLGLALEMEGRRGEATMAYEQVHATRTLDSDLLAERLAAVRAAVPMAASERALLRARLAFASGRYEVALRRLDSLQAGSVPAHLQAELIFWRGRTLHAQGQLDGAAQAYRAVLVGQTNTQDRWEPWSQLHLAEIHEEQGAQEQAIAAYEAALAYEESYDYDQTLEQHARAALEQLR